MLLLADRGFYCWTLWNDAAATGADLLWRVTVQHAPARRRGRCPTGHGCRSSPTPRRYRRRAAPQRQPPPPRQHACRPTPARCPASPSGSSSSPSTVTTATARTRTEPYRLITTLLDCRAAPAASLAAGYARRWAIETGFREFKTYLRGPGRILRGRTPDLARQELWAYLVIYQAIRAIICPAAASPGLDPDRISFTAALHAIRRTLPAARTSPAAALAETEADLLTDLVPERDGRVCPRAVTEPRSAPTPPRRSDQPRITARHLHRHHHQPGPATPHHRQPAKTSPRTRHRPGPLKFLAG